jgi:hypothetical protein
MMGIDQLFTVDAVEEEPKDIELGRQDPFIPISNLVQITIYGYNLHCIHLLRCTDITTGHT